MPPDDGWTGYRDGSFRGHHLQQCRVHLIWYVEDQPCPLCLRDAYIRALERVIRLAPGVMLPPRPAGL